MRLKVILLIVGMLGSGVVIGNENNEDNRGSIYVVGGGNIGWMNRSKCSNRTEVRSAGSVYPSAFILKEYGHKVGFGGAVGVGYKRGDWRMEVQGRYNAFKAKREYRSYDELTHVKGVGQDSDPYRMKVKSLFLNIFRDIGVTEKVTFYMGAGPGLGEVHVRGSEILDEPINLKKKVFCFQGMLGFSWQVTERVSGYVHYTLMRVGGFGVKKEKETVLSGGTLTSKEDADYFNKKQVMQLVEVGIRVTLN